MLQLKLIWLLLATSLIFSQGEALSKNTDEVINDTDHVKATKTPRILFKQQSTTTVTLLSLLTSTLPYTCFLYAAPLMPCTGRRRRRSAIKLLPGTDFEDVPIVLNGSLQGKEQSVEEHSKKRGRILFTVWHSISSTFTGTVYSTNRSVTVSVSAFCTAPNVSINAC